MGNKIALIYNAKYFEIPRLFKMIITNSQGSYASWKTWKVLEIC